MKRDNNLTGCYSMSVQCTLVSRADPPRTLHIWFQKSWDVDGKNTQIDASKPELHKSNSDYIHLQFIRHIRATDRRHRLSPGLLYAWHTVICIYRLCAHTTDTEAVQSALGQITRVSWSVYLNLIYILSAEIHSHICVFAQIKHVVSYCVSFNHDLLF